MKTYADLGVLLKEIFVDVTLNAKLALCEVLYYFVFVTFQLLKNRSKKIESQEIHLKILNGHIVLA